MLNKMRASAAVIVPAAGGANAQKAALPPGRPAELAGNQCDRNIDEILVTGRLGTTSQKKVDAS